MMANYWWERRLVLLLVMVLSLSGCLRLGRGPAAPRTAVTVTAIPLNTPQFAAGGSQSQIPTPAATETAPATVQSDAAVPLAWFRLAYNLVQAEALSPPVAARFFGYAGVTLYEAVVPGMPGYQSLAGQLNELAPLPQPEPGQAYAWPVVANSALATMFRTSFAGRSDASLREIATLQKQLDDGFAAAIPEEVLQRSRAQGQLVGLAMFEWSLTDGYAHLAHCTYQVPAGPGLWQPTPPQMAAPLEPCWGQMRPFVLQERAGECQPAQAPLYSEATTSAFYLQALEVYQTVNNLTPAQAEIARFWSDDPGKTGTPPGHSLAVLNQVIQSSGAGLDRAAEAYARVGIGLADAFISCWETKYATDVIRPITYIRAHIDPQWNVAPGITTPPFPEFTSGHSVQTGAFAEIMGALFGENTPLIDHTHDGLGYAPRSFGSFRAMAAEAALSRLYGGIHYRAAIEIGLQQGQCIGRRVNALQFRRSAPGS